MIGQFERSTTLPPAALLNSPGSFTSEVIADLDWCELRAADVFLQIGKDPAESPANDPDAFPLLNGRQALRMLQIQRPGGAASMELQPRFCAG